MVELYNALLNAQFSLLKLLTTKYTDKFFLKVLFFNCYIARCCLKTLLIVQICQNGNVPVGDNK